MSDYTATILHETLTDGSKVYNVRITDRREGGSIFLEAVTEEDAIDLADTITRAISTHTNARASLGWPVVG